MKINLEKIRQLFGLKKKATIQVSDRKKMLKSKNKNELVHMIIQNELVISKMMKKFKINNLKQFM